MTSLLMLALLTPGQDAVLMERVKALPAAGTRWYAYRRKGEKMGHLRVTASPARHDGREALQIDFAIKIRFQGKALDMETTTLAHLDAYLTPIRINIALSEGKDQKTLTATFADGKATFGDRTKEAPPAMITSEAELLLVGALNLKKGTKLAYASWETEDMRAKTEHVLEVLGPEVIVVDGKDLKCTKILHSGKGCGKHYYWVDGDRRVVRVLIDGRKELLLTSEREATAEK